MAKILELLVTQSIISLIYCALWLANHFVTVYKEFKPIGQSSCNPSLQYRHWSFQQQSILVASISDMAWSQIFLFFSLPHSTITNQNKSLSMYPFFFPKYRNGKNVTGSLLRKRGENNMMKNVDCSQIVDVSVI